jgi:hypothetical protein
VDPVTDARNRAAAVQEIFMVWVFIVFVSKKIKKVM